MESLYLSCIVASYDVHFAKYCEGHKQVSQLVPSLVLKKMFKRYKDHYINSPFVEETLKKINTNTSNENNFKKTIFQCVEVLEQLKCVDGHAAQNVLKRRQSIIDPCSPSTSSGDLKCLISMSPDIQASSKGMKNSLSKDIKTPIKKCLTMTEMLSVQSRNFVAITNHLTNDFNKKILLVAKRMRDVLRHKRTLFV